MGILCENSSVFVVIAAADCLRAWRVVGLFLLYVGMGGSASVGQ